MKKDKNTLTDNLLKQFTNSDKPLQLLEISKSLGISAESKEYGTLKSILKELVNNGILIKSSRRRYSLKEAELHGNFKGIIKIKEGRGTVEGFFDINEPDFKKNKTKIIIKRKNLFTALDGDVVKFKMLAQKKGKKPQAEVIEIVERKERNITGIIEYDGNFYFLIPDEDIYLVDFIIPPNKLNKADHGDKVAAKFISWDNPHKSPKAEIIEILGKAGEPDAEFHSIVREFSLPESFSDNVLNEAQVFAKKINLAKVELFDFNEIELSNSVISGKRVDLRQETIVTIDPEDAKDFDDALSLNTLPNGNYLLGVHIADVSNYVSENSFTDKEALKRGNSIYLVDRVVPMLPEILSNDVCSLKPNTIRLTFSVFMEVNKKGVINNYLITESVIKSKKRYSYNDVLKIINDNEKYQEVKGTRGLIVKLHQLAQILRKTRFQQGGINFETVEVKFLLDENKNPVEAILKTGNDSTNLVEECMLAANKTVATHIDKLSAKLKMLDTLPFIYRIHPEPNKDKLKNVLEFIKLTINKKIPTNSSSKAINDFVKIFEGKPEKPIVHQMLVRSMPKAEYSNQNIGHYGLGFKHYTHFTSPIRRYPDLMVHRLLKEYSKEKISLKKIRSLEYDLDKISEHCSDTEKLAMDAERASVKYAQCILASKYIWKTFDGTISGVASFGIFVVLDSIFAEGLLHIRDLDDDYYLFDEPNFRLIGKNNKKIFQFGKRIKVLISNVNINKRKIDLLLVK